MSEHVVLNLNKMNGNGRLYTKECVAAALAKLTGPLPVYDYTHENEEQVGSGTVSVKEDVLIANCNVSSEKIAARLADGRLHVRTMGVATLGDDGVIANDFELTGLMITDDPA